MTIKEMRVQTAASLAASGFDTREAKQIADRVVGHVRGYNAVDLVLNANSELLPESVDWIGRMVQRIANGEPMQYVLGTAYFRGRDFAVTPATLIPRPETQGLVDMVVDDLKSVKDAAVLDIGTGSGCIAISIALDVPFSQVDAIDISKDAIKVAQQNARNLKAKVNFYVANALELPKDKEKYDAIVSNPPYVLDSEKANMDARVLDYEPSTALFVPDNNPLIFYQAIADYALTALKPSGNLYFEINPLCSAQLSRMLKAKGFRTVEIIRDYIGKERFCKTSVRY